MIELKSANVQDAVRRGITDFYRQTAERTSERALLVETIDLCKERRTSIRTILDLSADATKSLATGRP